MLKFVDSIDNCIRSLCESFGLCFKLMLLFNAQFFSCDIKHSNAVYSIRFHEAIFL